jgi:hypothetical protein
MDTIRHSVGRGGVNQPSDVRLVQELLNKNLPIPMRSVAVNGFVDAQTIALIEEFQKRVIKMSRPDGRVDPGGQTFKALLGNQRAPAHASRRQAGPRLGQDGPMPPKYGASVRSAIEIAWKLDENPKFVEVFRNTVSKLSGKDLPSDAYAIALNKMVINHAETSKDQRAVQELKSDAEAKKKERLYKSPPAFSIMNGTQIWIRSFALEKGERVIASGIIHEAAHLVGAPPDPLAEYALDAIHNEAKLPR